MFGLDLFSGIGGISEALAGYVQPIAYCEVDRHCRATLLSRQLRGEIPCAPIWGNVKTLKSSHLPASPEILYGGFPCQDISAAGRGAGLEGKRSRLFWEIARLIGEIRPRFVFLENVPTLRTRGADVVAAEMARLRYDCRWGVLSAADVGANHLRHRWWLLAHAECTERGPGESSGHDGNGATPRRQETPSGARTSGADGRERILADADSNALWLELRWRRWKERTSAAVLGDDGQDHVADPEIGRAELLPDEGGQETAHVDGCGEAVADAASERLQGPEPKNGGSHGAAQSEGFAQTDWLEGCGEDLANAYGERFTVFQGSSPDGFMAGRRVPCYESWWHIEPAVRRVADGIPLRRYRLRGLGNAVVPAQAREAFERLMGLK